MHRSTARRSARALATSVVALGLLGAAAPTATAAEPEVGYLAQAYGTYAYSQVGDIKSGPTGYTGLACTAEAGRKSTNNTAKGDLRDLGQAGATETFVESTDEDGVRTSHAFSETAGASLLGGLVKADAITSESAASWDGESFHAEHHSVFANLRVLGIPLDVEPAPNTKIELALPGIGTIGLVELNKQEVKEVRGEFRVSTTALHVAILTDNPLGLEVGTHVYIGVSRAHLVPPQLGYLTGSGFASKVTLLDGIVQSGRTSLAGLACTGGTARNAAASTDLDALGNAGGADTKAEGVITDELVSGTVTNEIAGVSLLDGLIEAEVIKSVASASLAAGSDKVKLSSHGSVLAGLKINGEPILSPQVAPNTKIDLLGLATITLNKVEKTATKISVTQIEIVLAEDIAGLPTGSKIEIGHAEAGITPSV